MIAVGIGLHVADDARALDFMLVPAIAGIGLDEAARDPERAIAAKLERLASLSAASLPKFTFGLE